MRPSLHHPYVTLCISENIRDGVKLWIQDSFLLGGKNVSKTDEISVFGSKTGDKKLHGFYGCVRVKTDRGVHR